MFGGRGICVVRVAVVDSNFLEDVKNPNVRVKRNANEPSFLISHDNGVEK
jgi:hypothetical protein